ncbi:MAG: type II toxin-antitoxin system PemK/MazF family toxin [Acidobacteriota bacterium]|nr:type II toxin-antitoxin system PemK/MazF family toxin [Acidobacteriota bacterium]
MEINQGDIFWFDAGEPRGLSPAYSRPVVVIQNNVFNRSPLGTVLVCALTTNLRRAKAPGNVLLDENEADLPKQSVIVVSQVLTIDKSELIDKIGALSKERINEILEGVKLLTEPREVDEEIE